jgi:sporulation protein YqfC
VEKKERKAILERTAALFDLPADQFAGVPKVELIGKEELRMFHHRGILAYGTEEIHISGGAILVRVCGQNLELRAMNADELLVTGQIGKVEVE